LKLESFRLRAPFWAKSLLDRKCQNRSASGDKKCQKSIVARFSGDKFDQNGALSGDKFHEKSIVVRFSGDKFDQNRALWGDQK
jgi:hypothetical protein